MLLAKLIRFLIKEAGQKLYFEYALKPPASFLKLTIPLVQEHGNSLQQTFVRDVVNFRKQTNVQKDGEINAFQPCKAFKTHVINRVPKVLLR